ncbi:hypothetical protein [Micromonospora sp. URMC 103]|uniref:hypothetical protein n=1 Tax=Micromonospora sp. URMC 103 TaxID=3423406 RepID=UPI003F1B1551
MGRVKEVSVVSASASGARTRLLEALSQERVPDRVLQLFKEKAGTPRVGQFWRARWGDVTELVLLLQVDAGEVGVAPASLEDEYADDQTIVLPPALTSLNSPVAVWAGISRTVPVCVLDRQVGEARFDLTMNWVKQATARGAACGRPVTSAIDPLVEFRSGLVDAMTTLTEATWAPAGTGQLTQLITAAGITMSELVERLDVAPQRALAIRRGQAAATETEAQALAAVLQMGVVDILNANPTLPPDLISELSQPSCRQDVSRLAKRWGRDEREVWQVAAFGVYELAARQTGNATQPAWAERINRYFSILLE